MIQVDTRRWWLPRRIHAICLWPFVFYQRGWRSPKLEAHERYHWRQQWRWGVLPWFAAYIILLVVYRTGGRRHPMERRAYEAGDRVQRETDWVRVQQRGR